jgi:hypothetical protein
MGYAYESVAYCAIAGAVINGASSTIARMYFLVMVLLPAVDPKQESNAQLLLLIQMNVFGQHGFKLN